MQQSLRSFLSWLLGHRILCWIRSYTPSTIKTILRSKPRTTRFQKTKGNDWTHSCPRPSSLNAWRRCLRCWAWWRRRPKRPRLRFWFKNLYRSTSTCQPVCTFHSSTTRWETTACCIFLQKKQGCSKPKRELQSCCPSKYSDLTNCSYRWRKIKNT